MTTPKTTRTVALEDGTQLQVEVRTSSSYQDVGAVDLLNFDAVFGALQNLSTSIHRSFERAKPSRASIEFGMELTVESGKLITLICQGSSTANFTVTLEWERPKHS